MNANSLNNLFILLIFGSIILLAFLVMANPTKVNKKANYWFGIFLLLWGSFWLEEIAAFSGFGALNPVFSEIIHYLQFYLSLVFYLSVSFYINPNRKFTVGDLRHLVLPLLYLAVLVINANRSLTVYPPLSAVGKDQPGSYWPISLAMLNVVQAVVYTTMSLRKIRRHQKQIQKFASDTLEIDLGWLEYIIILLLAISIFFGGYSLLYNASAPNVYVHFVLLCVVFFVAYYSLKQKEIYPLNEKQRTELIALNEEAEPDTKKKIVPDEEIELFKNKLTGLMEKEKPYLDSELNLVKLSELLSISPHQLSYVINTGFNENFFQYINKYRVEKAKELLLNDEKDNVTILGIAFESGFNSKTSFNATFKKITQQTPSSFKKNSTVL